MKKILSTVLFLQIFATFAFATEYAFIDFNNYPSASYSSCIFTVDGVKMKLYNFFTGQPSSLICHSPQGNDQVYVAKINRCDLPLRSSSGILSISAEGGCVMIEIKVEFTDGTFQTGDNSIEIDESEKSIKEITITEIECGLVRMYNGQPDPFIPAVKVSFYKDDYSLISPENESSNNNTDLEFTWNGNSQTPYVLQIDTLQTFNNPVYQFNVVGTEKMVSGLQNNTTYYWRVKQINSYCPDAWSDIWKFTTVISLDIFQNIIEAPEPIVFRENINSKAGNVFEYDVAADASLTMLFKRNRGSLTIRNFNGIPENGFLIDSTDTEGIIWGKYESPHTFTKDKVIYLDYWHEPGLLQPDITIKLNIRPTPVIFVHNLFLSAGETWGPVASLLNSNGWIFPYVHSSFNYRNDVPFTEDANEIEGQIDVLLLQIRSGGDFVNKVSLVGHGMGGLVIRQYLKDNPNEKNISRVITINTPHSGTQMANWILDTEPGIGYWISREALKYSGAPNNKGGFANLDKGGLGSIRTDSPYLLSLNSSSQQIPSHSIISQTSVACVISLSETLFELAAGGLSFGMGAFGVIIEIIDNAKTLICEDDLKAHQAFCVLDYYILKEENDGFVGVSSQLGGLYSPYNTNIFDNSYDYLHFNNPRQATTINAIKKLLETDSEGSQFNKNGFDPVVLSPLSQGSEQKTDMSNDTIVEISILNIQNLDTLCTGADPIIAVEGNANTNRLMAIYFFENDSIRIDTIHLGNHNFNIPVFQNYEGQVNIGIIGSDGYGHYDFDTLSIYLKNSTSIEPKISIASDVSEICAGQEVVFSATPFNEGASPDYQWFVNGAPVGDNSPVFSTSSLANGSEVYCSLTSSEPCANPKTISSSPVSILVNPSVSPSVDLKASQTAICSGDEVLFSATPFNGGSSPVYQWFENNNPVGNNTSTYSSTSLNDGDEVHCIMTSNADCALPTQANSEKIKMSVTPIVTPEIKINSSSNEICAGDEVIFTSSAINGGGAPTYQWFENGNPVNGANSPVYSTTALADGAQISCMMSSSVECADPKNAISNSITINVLSLDMPELSIIQDTIFALNYNGDQYGYAWYLNGNLISTEPFSICQDSGIYELVINIDDCTTSNTIHIDGCTVGTNENSKLNSISVYPNPADKTITIAGKGGFDSTVLVTFYNIFGQEMVGKRHVFEKQDFFVELNIADLPSGNYFVLIVSGNYSRIFKIIKT